MVRLVNGPRALDDIQGFGCCYAVRCSAGHHSQDRDRRLMELERELAEAHWSTGSRIYRWRT